MNFEFLSSIVLSLVVSAAVSAAELPSSQNIQQISQSSYWKRLLHYRPGLFGVDSSEADGKGFFLSLHGHDDPEAELKADLDAFLDPHSQPLGPEKQHAQCVFPERYRFLKTELHLHSPDQPCVIFNTWKTRFHAQSITLVYAAAYFGAPSSMFGHTFLRVDSAPRAGQSRKNDMLDYGISFDAITEPGTFAYPIKGLLGFFPGMYSQMPYFIKANSYNDMESRDLWEYQLNLTPDQIDHFLNHVWEMGTTYFNYYFFNRNCSYQLLTLFEVANPSWNLKQPFHAMAIPVDTLRAVKNQPDAVRSVHYRPSIMHILENRLSKLNANELERFHKLKNDVSQANASDTARTLDALMDWQRYTAIKNSINTEDAEKKIDWKLLQLRAKRDDPPDSLDDIQSELHQVPPELGHPSKKTSLSSVTENTTPSLSLEVRPAFHDLLDPDDGFLPSSALNIGRLRGSYLTDGSGILRLDELTLGEVISYQPFTRLKDYLSWQVSGSLYRPVDLGCASCLAGNLQGGAGLTIGKTGATLSLLGTGHAEFSGVFNSVFGQSYRAGPGALAVGLLKISDHFHALASYEHIRYFPSPDQHFLSKTEITLSYTLVPFDFRLKAASSFAPWQYTNLLMGSVGYYF